MTIDEINQFVQSQNIPKYRAAQVYNWLQKGVYSFDEMTNVSNSVIDTLKQNFYISTVIIEKRFVSKLDGTVKYLYKLNDGQLIETVVMKYKYGYTICVSTQVGCLMGCGFCASTIGGKSRDLTAGEILGQIIASQKDLNIRISHVVLMGMGEPLDNYDNTVRFLKLVSSDDGLNIGMRHISLSTCGLVDKIKELEKLKLQLTLSISLHAPNDEIRNKIMPVNKKWNVESLIDACKSYINTTGRRISFEYALIKGLNDTQQCAHELISLLKDLLCHVNLIPANQVHEGKFNRPDDTSVRKFYEILNKNGINTTIRRTLGADISASCGQLKGKR